MNSPPTQQTTQPRKHRDASSQRAGLLLAFGIIWIAITGYYIGLSSPMTASEADSEFNVVDVSIEFPHQETAAVIPATSYAELPTVRRRAQEDRSTKLAMLKETPYDLHTTITVSNEEKRQSLAERAQLRAFNGAPPTVPHPIDQVTSQACMVCHEKGLRSESLRASKMPHPYYANCTQCHVEQNSQYVEVVKFRDNSFVGMPAPTAGSRAFDKAPPTMPHSSWLRDDCLSCHGRTARSGLQTTHPWRANCQQCHAPSSQLEQSGLARAASLLPPPKVKESDE